MSEAPSMFKRSTKTKPRPRRERSPNDITSDSKQSTEQLEGGEPTRALDSPVTLAAKLKAKQKSRIKPQTRLSFGGGGEDEISTDEFKVKKSALSQKLKLPRTPSTPQSSGLHTDLSQASIFSESSILRSSTPVYNRAYLSELKAATPSAPPPVDTSIISNLDNMYGDTSMDVSVTYDDNQEDTFGDNGTPSLSIPAESSIQAVKQKRERLRALGSMDETSSEDYISLSLTKRDMQESEDPHPESRLAREDDEVGEGDEEGAEYTGAKERIALGRKARKEEAKKKKREMEEMIEEAQDDEDDEMKRWEDAQVKRGGTDDNRLKTTERVREVYKPHPIPTPTPLPSFSVASTRITSTLSNLLASRTTHLKSMENAQAEQAAADEKQVEMRAMVEKSENKRVWFEDMREWMESLAGLLEDKLPTLKRLEEEHVSILTEKHSIISRRRQEDDEDDLCLFLPLPPPAFNPPPMQGSSDTSSNAGPPHSSIRAARRAARTARWLSSDASTSNSDVSSTPSFTRAGLGARSRVQASTSTPSSTEVDEGYFTDSDLPSADSFSYVLARSRLTDEASSLLLDVKAPEFLDPKSKGGLAARFNQWREKWPESYTGTWGGLALVGAWEFWVRWEIIGWDVLAERRSLDSFEWYQGLYDYSRPRNPDAMDMDDDEEDEPELGPDGDLVASMISTTLIPYLSKVLSAGGFDPYSTKHVKRAVELIEQVEASLDRTDLKFQALLKSVLPPFQTAISSTIILLAPALNPSNPPSVFDPAGIPARKRLLARHTKLLSNLLAWRRAVGPGTQQAAGATEVGVRGQVDELVQRMVSEVLSPIARSGWEVGGEEGMRKVKGMLPPDLAQQGWALQIV